jgi:hypothetical protein
MLPTPIGIGIEVMRRGKKRKRFVGFDVPVRNKSCDSIFNQLLIGEDSKISWSAVKNIFKYTPRNLA